MVFCIKIYFIKKTWDFYVNLTFPWKTIHFHDKIEWFILFVFFINDLLINANHTNFLILMNRKWHKRIAYSSFYSFLFVILFKFNWALLKFHSIYFKYFGIIHIKYLFIHYNHYFINWYNFFFLKYTHL